MILGVGFERNLSKNLGSLMQSKKLLCLWVSAEDLWFQFYFKIHDFMSVKFLCILIGGDWFFLGTYVQPDFEG